MGGTYDADSQVVVRRDDCRRPDVSPEECSACFVAGIDSVSVEITRSFGRSLSASVRAFFAPLGIDPGQGLSIVGYNDIPLASRLPTPLTSVATPFLIRSRRRRSISYSASIRPGADYARSRR